MPSQLADQEHVEHDAGVGDTGPMRLCIVRREHKATEALIRFVAAPDGTIVPDLARRLPGRGVWVTATQQDVAAAIKAKAFARSLKRQVVVPSDLAERVDALQAARLTQAIALANKAGELIAGFTKVEAAIEAGEAIALISAADGALDGRQKLERKLRAIAAAAQREVCVVDGLTLDELSLAIGRENVVHAALREGGAARRVLTEAGRLRRYRSGRCALSTV